MSLFAELRRRNVIRVAIAYALIAWVLLQAADFALDLIDAPGWVLQALAVLAVIGLPAVLVFSWVFEMTPEGIKREKEIDRSASITAQTGRKLDKAIIGALVLAVGYLLVDKLWLQTGSEYLGSESNLQEGASSQQVSSGDLTLTPNIQVAPNTRPSVAVLPFVNMSDDKQNEYFSDGLTETLLHMLAQLPELQVAARTSSFAFKGQNKSVSEIATALGVAHILEGSVQKSGERVRVTAQLIRADDGFHVWSQNYTRPLEDIFAIQDEIAADVAKALDVSLLGGGKPDMSGVATHDLSAYDSYLKGLEQQAIFSYGGLAEADKYFKQALSQDLEFTDAQLALVRNNLLSFQTGQIAFAEAHKQAMPMLAAVQSRQADNRNARAYQLLFELSDPANSGNADELTEMVTELRNLLPLIPTETLVRNETARQLAFLDREQEALEVLEAGLLVDPLDPNVRSQLGGIYADMKDLDRARQAYEKALELAPDNPNSLGNLADLELKANNLPEALDLFRRATLLDPQDPEIPAEIARILFALDLPEEGKPWAARTQVLGPGSPVARVCALQEAEARGELELALEMAESMIRDQVQNRRGSFFTALYIYADLMMREERSREAYQFLVSIRPDIEQFDKIPDDNLGWLMQGFAVLLMSGFESFETRRQAWDQVAAARDALGLPWRDDGSLAMMIGLIITGDLEGAKRQFLEHRMSRPPAENLYLHEPSLAELYAPLYAEPEVAAAMADRSRQVAQLRSEVEEMLQLPEWNL